MVNEKWEQQKEYVRAKLSEEKAGSIYRQRKIDVEPVFGFLKANLRFTRFSVRGKSKVENEIGIALMAVNLRKYTANRYESIRINDNKWKNGNLSSLKFPFFILLKLFCPSLFFMFYSQF